MTAVPAIKAIINLSNDSIYFPCHQFHYVVDEHELKIMVFLVCRYFGSNNLVLCQCPLFNEKRNLTLKTNGGIIGVGKKIKATTFSSSEKTRRVRNKLTRPRRFGHFLECHSNLGRVLKGY